MFKRFMKDESGATAIEYGLLASLIAVLVIAGAKLIGGQLDTMFRDVAQCLEDAGKAETGGQDDGNGGTTASTTDCKAD